MYEYKMVQIPPNLTGVKKSEKHTAAAYYLEDQANAMAALGWEFYRVDTFGVEEQPGCSGKTQGIMNYYVITFRRKKD
ncbi:DUF4177 domain-containing protein [Salmonella enterica]|uniref:DUF4177 domain-containing protein n=2 Tax=Salmonella enterica TaxID=28901 RepID=A0A5V2R0A1_SALER|nr:DUF4177 domain-containing protein [Salmonella enterica]EBP3999892.1 DUF4177 domain-containing protein [Salmonella enterica subsp. enterica]ECF0261263.1 DUF4177 domain-containing protein [Salmonella enterica subsp. enterica serovar Java]ECJ2315906.1 DUF4177 domain-containing protein [Salmonella enterica subsp. diarizonae]EEP4024537.1 DUF4177 domain-containing protein [Salmonella enterica subsp. enterica serovar Javiana]